MGSGEKLAPLGNLDALRISVFPAASISPACFLRSARWMQSKGDVPIWGNARDSRRPRSATPRKNRNAGLDFRIGAAPSPPSPQLIDSRTLFAPLAAGGELEILNRRWHSYLPNERVGHMSIFHEAAILDDSIYIVGKNLYYLWIWEVDENFNITRTFWAKPGENFIVMDFLPFKEDGRLKFAFVRINPDTEVKISVFTPK